MLGWFHACPCGCVRVCLCSWHVSGVYLVCIVFIVCMSDHSTLMHVRVRNWWHACLYGRLCVCVMCEPMQFYSIPCTCRQPGRSAIHRPVVSGGMRTHQPARPPCMYCTTVGLHGCMHACRFVCMRVCACTTVYRHVLGWRCLALLVPVCGWLCLSVHVCIMCVRVTVGPSVCMQTRPSEK